MREIMWSLGCNNELGISKGIAHGVRTATFWGLCGLMLLFTVDVDPLAVVISGYTISVLDGLLATVLGMWLVTKVTLLPGDLKTTGGNPRQKQVLWSALTAWFAAMLIAALTARQDVRASLIFWGRSVASMLLVGVIVDMATTRRRFLILLLALAAGGILAALGGLLEATSAQPVLDLFAMLRGARSFWHFNELLRVSGTFSHPNYLATVMITLLPVLLLLPLALRWRHWRWLPLCGALMCAVVLVLTQSRGAVFASVVSLSGIGVMAWRQRQRAGVWLSAGGVAVVLITGMLYLLLNPAVTIRLVREADDHLWYPAEYVAPATLTAQPNERLTVPVTLMNTSIRAWAIDGKAPVNLTHHIVWMSDGDPMGDENRSRYLVYSGERTPLPRPVLPQESITVQASIIAPAVPGTYAVEWDLIREGVTLFSRKGTPTGQTMLNVSGAVSPAMAPTGDFVQVTEPPLSVSQRGWNCGQLHFNFR